MRVVSYRVKQKSWLNIVILTTSGQAAQCSTNKLGILQFQSPPPGDYTITEGGREKNRISVARCRHSYTTGLGIKHHHYVVGLADFGRLQLVVYVTSE